MPDTKQDKLSKIKAILELTKGDPVTPKDIALVVKTLIEAVKQVKAQLEQLVAQESKDRGGDIRYVTREMQIVKKEAVSNDAETEKRVLAKIPKQVDISPLEKRISALENEEEAEIPSAEDIIKDLPRLATAVRDSLELLRGDERLDPKAINGFEELQKTVEELKKMGGQMRIIANVRSVQVYDLSSSTNGVLKTFTVPGVLKPLYVMGSDFPTTLFLGNGFTYDAPNNQITLTTDNAPSSGSQLGFIYVG